MIRIIAIALAATLAADLAQADSKRHKDDRYEYGDRHASQGWCPPGLAKKNPPCVPPGQAKKARIGDHYWDYNDYRRVERRDDRYDFYRIGDVVVSADRKTGRIMHLFDELGNLIE